MTTVYAGVVKIALGWGILLSLDRLQRLTPKDGLRQCSLCRSSENSIRLGHFTFVGQATKIPKDAQRLWTVHFPKEDLGDANRHCQQHNR
jgi:hypothetical protein